MDWLSLIIGAFVGFGLSRVVNIDFKIPFEVKRKGDNN